MIFNISVPLNFTKVVVDLVVDFVVDIVVKHCGKLYNT